MPRKGLNGYEATLAIGHCLVRPLQNTNGLSMAVRASDADKNQLLSRRYVADSAIANLTNFRVAEKQESVEKSRFDFISGARVVLLSKAGRTPPMTAEQPRRESLSFD